MIKKPKQMFHILVVMSFLVGTAWADMVVIVHPSNNNAIDQAFLKSLYLGKTHTFADGNQAQPLDLPPGDELRETFLRIAVDQKPVQYRRYWSKALFTGAGDPPEEMGSQALVLQAVSENPQAIGYIEAALLNDSVKAVLRVRM